MMRNAESLRPNAGNTMHFDLVEAYARALFALCVRITRDAALAEDAVKEAL